MYVASFLVYNNYSRPVIHCTGVQIRSSYIAHVQCLYNASDNIIGLLSEAFFDVPICDPMNWPQLKFIAFLNLIL